MNFVLAAWSMTINFSLGSSGQGYVAREQKQ